MRGRYFIAALALAVILMSLGGTVLAQSGPSGWFDIQSNLRVWQDVDIWDDLTVGDDVSVVGAITAEDLTLTDDLVVGDDVTIAGNLTSLGAPMTVVTTSVTPTVASGVFLIKSGGGAATVTLGTPTTAQNGLRMDFLSLEATAHVVTAPTIGFNEANAGGDTCTFSTTVGSSLSLIAYGGEYYILNNTSECTPE